MSEHADIFDRRITVCTSLNIDALLTADQDDLAKAVGTSLIERAHILLRKREEAKRDQ